MRHGRKGDTYAEDEAELRRQLAALQAEADRLASDFKALYRRAANEYDDGNRALAKELAAEGRSLQARCESLNEAANEIRSRLGRPRREPQHPVTDVAGFDRSPSEEPPSLAEPVSKGESDERPTLPAFVGWPGHQAETRSVVERFLREQIPMEHLMGVSTITCVPRLEPVDGERARRGQCAVGGHITLAAAPPDKESRDWLFGTLSHEVGHVVYRRLPPATQAAWKALLLPHVALASDYADLYRELGATRLRREIFADAYRRYICEGSLLLGRDHDLYYFLADHVFDGREYR